MGIGGHMLGPVKLRRLSRLTGLPLDRACIRGQVCVGVVWTGPGACEDVHYAIDKRTGAYTEITDPDHWSTCWTHQLPQPRPALTVVEAAAGEGV